jgi:pimeloyl-ACP methyl ester carboxylesterase
MPLKLRGIVRALVRLAVIAGVTYTGVCGFVAWEKEEIIFPLRGRERAAHQKVLPGFESWWLKTPEGDVEAWWQPAEGASAEKPAPAVLVFHGNGELIDDSRDFAQRWHALGVHVLLVEYRGYGRSAGLPTINACRADSAAWFDRLAARADVRRDLILAHGFSLGGAFAAELAGQRPVGGLVLEGGPAGLVESAHDRGIWLIFTRERFDAVAVLRHLPPGVPVLITQGKADEVMPPRHGELLAAARPGAKVVWGKGSHYPQAVTDRPELLAELLAAARARAATAAPDKGLAPAADNSAL